MKFKKWLKQNYFHIICVIITLSFIACSIFVFSSSFIRIKESCVDFWTSIKFYVKKLFNLSYEVTPTINNYSEVNFMPFLDLPSSWSDFANGWNNFWKIFVSKSNFVAYFDKVLSVIIICVKSFVFFGLPIILLLFIFFKFYFIKHNNKYNKDSFFLSSYKFLLNITYVPVKNLIKSFCYFVKEHSIYFKLWLLIWSLNFNLVTIIIELLAFCFYFIMSFDLASIYKQIYKLACDLSVPINSIPKVFLIFIILWLFDRFRRKIGYLRLNHFEKRNCGFINERPISSMACGTMGSRKTTLITDMSLSQEVMFKDKAFEKILENDLKFPHFPWCNLENVIKIAMKNHVIYNLATCKNYINKLALYFYVSLNVDSANKKALKRHLKKCFNISFDNMLFDYDYEHYGLTYNDKLEVVDIWNVLETYAQLYFIYIIQSSLILSNYSVRTDNLIEDLGNFALWNTDFFKRDSRLIDSFSRHAHIIDFDALRLGRKLVENNPKKDSFDFGVINITEVGKERKNQLELKELKKSEEIANQKNDGFVDWLKMVRHSATVDKFPFVKVISDEQRPESLGADARDLCEIIHIKEAGEFKLAMPFFFVEDMLCSFILKWFENFYIKYRFKRADNTLTMFLLKSLASKLQAYCKGVSNTFSYAVMKLQVESGTQDGNLNNKKYYLMSKKIYSKRFSTDCFSDYFATKNLSSKIGIDDLEEYQTEKATFDELKQQHSYFVNDLIGKQKIDKDK